MSNSEDCSVFFTSVYPKLLGNARPTVALKDCCIDPYFRCDSGRITQIYLASTSLSGSIPSDIEKLPMLTYLNLDSNSLTDSIPSSIGKLSQLKFLSVSSNSLSGNLPSELSKLSNLQYLSVSSNKLNDELSATFWRLTNLEELDLFGNAFTGTLPPQIGQLTKLKKLFLKQNSFSGPIPAEIGKLTQLTVLDLQNNSFSGQIPVEIRQLQNFKQFKFDSVNSGQDGSSIVSGSQVLIIALIGVIALVLIIIAIWYFKYRGKSQKQRDSELSHLVTVDTNRGTDYTHENSPTIVALESARNSPKYVASPVITSSNNSISSSNKSLPSQSIHKNSYETAIPQNLKYNGISRITQSSGSRESYRALRKYTDTSSGSVSDTVPKVTFIPKQQGATRNESVLYEASFSIKKKLTGKGGCGQVYMATFGKQNAVAKFPIHEKHEDLIHEESKLMGILKSKWTVEVLQFMSNMTIKISGQPYMPKNALLLEYMNLGCFSKYLRANPSFENLDYDINTYNSIINQTLSLIRMSAEGINFIHEKGYNHLDIKTENILLHRNTDGSIIAKISDFGSTRLNGGYDSVFLTPIYLAPEGRMAPGQANIPQRTYKYDIYAFGYCMLHTLMLEDYALGWGTRSWERKRPFIQTHIKNRDVAELVLSCLHDTPTERPDMKYIISKLNSYNQSDFQCNRNEVNMNPSTLNRNVGTLLVPTNNRNVHVSEANSAMWKHSPGSYFLTVKLQLTSPVSWETFIKSFQSHYIKSNPFNIEKFKLYMDPIDNYITGKQLESKVFKNLQPLYFDDVEQESIWADDLDEAIKKVLKDFA